jgi:hypothetical protein
VRRACSGAAPRLQQRREVAARTDLGDCQLHRPHPRVPSPHPGPVPIGRPVVAPLVAFGPDQGRHLGVHNGLGEHPDAFPEDVPILLFEELANERREVHSGLGHRRITSVSSSPARENSRNDARWPLACPASAAYRISTTSWDSNQPIVSSVVLPTSPLAS